jgi:Uma2 family endonuclease
LGDAGAGGGVDNPIYNEIMSAITPLTAEEFLNLPDAPGKQELLDGELISLPPAMYEHAEIGRAFQKLLETALDESRVRFFEGYQLTRGWLIPDVSATWPDQPVSGWLQGAPMIAIEIVSRGNTAAEIDRKVNAYLQEGAAEVWVVYPATRSMIVFRKDATLRVPDVYQCERIGVTVKLDELLPQAS